MVVESLERHEDISATADKLDHLVTVVQNPDTIKLLGEYAATQYPTTQFWITYIKMVSSLYVPSVVEIGICTFNKKNKSKPKSFDPPQICSVYVILTY